jgi:hypothetical protein
MPILSQESRADEIQFLMDYAEGSFFTLLMISLVIMSKC